MSSGSSFWYHVRKIKSGKLGDEGRRAFLIGYAVIQKGIKKLWYFNCDESAVSPDVLSNESKVKGSEKTEDLCFNDEIQSNKDQNLSKCFENDNRPQTASSIGFLGSSEPVKKTWPNDQTCQHLVRSLSTSLSRWPTRH